ncbi:MAG TPA: type II secretion system F family protein [Oligoflexia bacterium]|nr:type II secretion system F family protein [Oligoflexia bacterium]
MTTASSSSLSSPSFMIGYINIILIALAIFFMIYSFYPLLENKIYKSLQQHLDHCTVLSEKMFLPLNKKLLQHTLLIVMLFTAVVVLYITWGFYWVSFLLTLALLWFIWKLPLIILDFMWKRHLAIFDRQLVDGLNLMSNSLKSGLNLQQALSVLVKEMPKPLSQEFALVLSQKKLGLSIDQALEKMLERLPSNDLSIAIHSILILRETGGDLSETFDIIAHTIRERRKVDGKIEGLTAQGKMQGIILFSMPFAFGAFLYITNPQYIQPLFTTTLGWMFIIFAVILQTVGYFWIKKVISIDV